MNENATSRHDVAEMATEARAMVADGVQTVRDGVQAVREKSSEVGRRAALGIEARRDTVAGGLEGVADSLASTARYVREHQAKEMVGHVEGLIRAHPGKTLLAAVAIGFVAGRALRRD